MRVNKVRLFNNDEIVLNDLENGYTILVTFTKDVMYQDTIGYYDVKLYIIDTFRDEIVKVIKVSHLTKEQMDKSYSIFPRDETCWDKLSTVGRLKHHIAAAYEEFITPSKPDDAKNCQVCRYSLVTIDDKELLK